VQDTQHHHFIDFDAIVHHVRESTGACPPDIVVDHRVYLRGAVDTFEHLLDAEEELGSEP
jgi:hypothetical protein